MKMSFTRLILLCAFAWTCSAGPISRLSAIDPDVLSGDAQIYGFIVPISFAKDIALKSAARKQDDGITVTPVTPPWLVSSSTSVSVPATSASPTLSVSTAEGKSSSRTKTSSSSTSTLPPPLKDQPLVHSSTPGSPLHLTHLTHSSASSTQKAAGENPAVIHASTTAPAEPTSSSASVLKASTPGIASYLPVHSHTNSHTSSSTASERLTTPVTIYDGTTQGATSTDSIGAHHTSLPNAEGASAGPKKGLSSSQEETTTSSCAGQTTSDSPATGTQAKSKGREPHSSTLLKIWNTKPNTAESTGHVKEPSSTQNVPSKDVQATDTGSSARATTSSSSAAEQTALTAGIIVPISDLRSSITTGDSIQATPSLSKEGSFAKPSDNGKVYVTEVIVVPKGGGSPIATTYIDAIDTSHKTTSTSSTTPSTSSTLDTKKIETVTIHHTTTERVTITVSGPTITVTPTPPPENPSTRTTKPSKTQSDPKPTATETEETTTIQETKVSSVTISVTGPTVTVKPSTTSSSSTSETHNHHPKPTPAPMSGDTSHSDDTGGITVTPVTPAGFITVTVTKTVTVTEKPSAR